jgi:hypothetical protein
MAYSYSNALTQPGGFEHREYWFVQTELCKYLMTLLNCINSITHVFYNFRFLLQHSHILAFLRWRLT